MNLLSIQEIIEAKIEKLDAEKKQIQAKIDLLVEIRDEVDPTPGGIYMSDPDVAEWEEKTKQAEQDILQSKRKYVTANMGSVKQKPAPVPTRILSKTSRVNAAGKVEETIEEYID